MREIEPEPAQDEEGQRLPAPPVENTVEMRLSACEDHLRVLRREWKSMLLEWESTYDQMRTLYARLARRDARAAKQAEPEPTHQPNPAALALLAGHSVRDTTGGGR